MIDNREEATAVTADQTPEYLQLERVGVGDGGRSSSGGVAWPKSSHPQQTGLPSSRRAHV